MVSIQLGHLRRPPAADRFFGFSVGNDMRAAPRYAGVFVGPVSTSDCSNRSTPDGQAFHVTLPPPFSPKPSSGRRFLVPKENFLDHLVKTHAETNFYDPTILHWARQTYPTHRSCIGQPLIRSSKVQHSVAATEAQTNPLQLRARS